MKKVVAFVMFLMSLSMNSQISCLDKPVRSSRIQTTCFEESENLNDSIRVVGSDGIHRNMKRSVFLSGIGSTQDLDQTLTLGNISDNNMKLLSGVYSIDFTSSNGSILAYDANTSAAAYFDPNSLKISNGVTTEYTEISKDGVLFKNKYNGERGFLNNKNSLYNIELSYPVGTANYAGTLPISVNGQYPNATTGDISISTGGISEVTGSSPITIANGTTTPVVGITQATTSTAGYLSPSDWNTFNGKQNALGFTPYNATNPAGYISSYTETDPLALKISNNLSDLGNITTAKTNLSLQNVNNTSDLNKPISTAEQTALNLKANLASPTFSGTVGGITASMIGLGNVPNTDATLRANHTGTQLSTTISDFSASVKSQLAFVAGSGAYNSATGNITIPTNNNQITNGAGYITASALTPYLTSYTETDPIVKAISGIVKSNGTTISAAVSGTDFKTVNSTSILGAGNINAAAAFQKYGDIYNKNSWTDLTDFTSNSAGVSVVSNKLSFTGGTAQNSVAGGNSQLPSFLRLNNYTGLDRWSMTVKVKVNQVPSATSYGFSVGVIGDTSLGNSSESSALGFFNMTSNGTLTGKVSLILGTQNNLIASSNTVITFSQNDYIELIVERELSNIKVSARNITTNSGITTATFNYNTNFADGTTNPFLPNSGTFVIAQHGGSFIVDDIKVKSSAVKRANLMLITDSKGIYNAPVDLAFPQLLERKYEGVVWNGGPIDITQCVINKLPEILALNPKQIVLAIGRNDVMTGIATGTWQANLVTIDNTLTAAGIAVYWTNGIKETSTTQTSLRDYIATTFAGRVINTYAATDYAACVSADGIHPSIIGHQQTADAIIASGFIVDYSNYNSSKQPSQSVTDLRYTGQIIAGGGTTQKPTTSSAGDVIVPDGGGLISGYQGAPSWYGKYIPFAGGTAKFINSYTASNKYSFQWLGSNGSNGTETTTMVLTDRGNLILKPNASPNMLVRTDLPTSGMYLTDVGGGIASSYTPTSQSSVGQTAQILPFTTNYATEIRNKSRIGKIDKYVSNGTDDGQMLAETTNAKGRTSFFGTGVTVPNITSANRDLIGSVIGGYMTGLGSGVTTATVAFSGGGGTGATATAIISIGQIQGITITNGGSGYTSTPTVTFTGDGTASSATVVLSMDLLQKGIVIYNTTLDVFQGWNGTMWMTF